MFIERYENASDTTLFDERKPLQDKLTVSLLTVNNTPSATSKVNTSFDFENASYVLSAFSDVQATNRYDTDSIDSTYLPKIKDKRSYNNSIYKISVSDFDKVVKASIGDDTTASFITSCVFYPFTFNTDLFKLPSYDSYIYVGNESKHVGAGYFADVDDTSGPKVKVIQRGICPYLVTDDFTFSPRTNDFTGFEPVTTYEIYIAFYGWYKIPNPEKIFNDRLLIYYSVDYESGSATVYLYDYTKHYLIFSSNVTLGVKTNIIATNNTENIKQKQASDLNMLLSLIGSGIAVGAGVVSGNPLAIATGALSGTKAIASNVNTHNSIFERAQTSLGASDNLLHAPYKTIIRVSYHDNISIDNATYARMQGLPYKKYVTNGNLLNGYVEIPEIHFDAKGYMIYEDEKDEIINLLQKGVIF